MAQGKGIQYYLTKRGINFNMQDPKYIPEEREIIDILGDGRLSIKRIMELVNKGLGRNRGWGYISAKIEGLCKEGLLQEYSQGGEFFLNKKHTLPKELHSVNPIQ